MNKKLFLFGLITIFLLSFVLVRAEPTIIKGEYHNTFSIDATNYPIHSCNVEANYESGSCQYAKFCYVIIPKGTSDLSQAIQKECVDITDTMKGSLTVNFAPPRGNRWAITTFLAIQDNTYDYQTYTWNTTLTIPMDYRSAEELISLCPEGQMLKNNICYKAQSVCTDQFKNNLCTNPYPLYVLDVGYGFDINNVGSYCSDRDDDGVCDNVQSLTCADANENGVCDSDDILIENSSCVDANHNWVCDSVEAQGVFCTKEYNPVHVGTLGTTDCITYPNKCFCEGVGNTNCTPGECTPVFMNLCYSNAECTPPCDGVVGICKNPDGKGNRCYYSGECNPTVIQCVQDADCPTSPCVGVSFKCNQMNRCEPIGKCITQPKEQSFWALLSHYFGQILAWLNNLFNW